MGLINIEMFKKELGEARLELANRDRGVSITTADTCSELAPLPYTEKIEGVNATQLHMNKIAKLLEPFISYGMWEGLLPSGDWRVSFGNIPPIFIEFDESTLTFRTRVQEKHKEHGIPRRVRWFENGIMETR